jgi:hypothetical protein
VADPNRGSTLSPYATLKVSYVERAARARTMSFDSFDPPRTACDRWRFKPSFIPSCYPLHDSLTIFTSVITLAATTTNDLDLGGIVKDADNFPHLHVGSALSTALRGLPSVSGFQCSCMARSFAAFGRTLLGLPRDCLVTGAAPGFTLQRARERLLDNLRRGCLEILLRLFSN